MPDRRWTVSISTGEGRACAVSGCSRHFFVTTFHLIWRSDDPKTHAQHLFGSGFISLPKNRLSSHHGPLGNGGADGGASRAKLEESALTGQHRGRLFTACFRGSSLNHNKKDNGTFDEGKQRVGSNTHGRPHTRRHGLRLATGHSLSGLRRVSRRTMLRPRLPAHASLVSRRSPWEKKTIKKIPSSRAPSALHLES